HRVALLASFDAGAHVPQLFEPDLADHPAAAALRSGHEDSDVRGGQQVVVELERRDVRAIRPLHRLLGYTEAGAVNRTGRQRPRAGVEDGDLAEFREVED